MSIAIFPLLTLAQSQDPILIGSIIALRTLPWLLFSVAGGVLVDRFDRRKIMVLANLVRGSGLLIMASATAYWGGVPYTLLALIAILLGLAEVLFDTGAIALVPQIVPKHELIKANGIMVSTEIIMNSAIGGVFGAFLFSQSPVFVITVNGLLYFSSSFGLRNLRIHSPKSIPLAKKSVLSDISRGFDEILSSKVLLGLSIIPAINNMAFYAIISTLVLYVKDYLHQSDVVFGVLNSSIAAGLFIGGLAVHSVVKKLGREKSYALNLVLYSVALFAIASFPIAWVMLIGFITAGIAWSIGNTVAVSFRQSNVANHDLGKVSAFSRLLGAGVQPIASFFGGLMVKDFGFHALYLAMAFLSLLSSVVFLTMIRGKSLNH